MKKPKFNVGDIVLDKQGEEHTVLGFSYDPDKGYVYRVSSTEIDWETKQIINGISFFTEKELKLKTGGSK